MSGGSAEIFVLPSGQCVGSQRRLIRSWIERFYPEFCNSFVSIACFAKSMTFLVAVYFLLALVSALFLLCRFFFFFSFLFFSFFFSCFFSFFFSFFFSGSVVVGLGLFFAANFLRSKRGLSLRFEGSLNADRSGSCLKGPSGGVVSSSALEFTPFEGGLLILESMVCCLKSPDIVLYGSSEHKM